MIVLDTNVVIYYLNRKLPITAWLDEKLSGNDQVALSTMSVVELFGFPKINPDERFALEQIVRSLIIIDVDLSIAREAARIRSELKLAAIDSVIAATAVLLRADLVSYDIAFRKIRDIKVIAP